MSIKCANVQKWASLKVMWCDCQGTINQALFCPLPLPLSPAKAKKCLFEQVESCALFSAAVQKTVENYFSSDLHFWFFVHCNALDVHCARKGKYTMQKACKRNVQKMALDLKNGHKRHLI